MKKYIEFTISLLMMLSFGFYLIFPSHAETILDSQGSETDYAEMNSDTIPVDTIPAETTVAPISMAEALALYAGSHIQSNGWDVMSCTITDPQVIAGLVASGDFHRNENGELPFSITIERHNVIDAPVLEFFPSSSIATPSIVVIPTPSPVDTTISINKTVLPEWQGTDLISSDVIMDGDTISTTFTVSGKADWTCSLGTSVQIGADIIGLGDVKGAVSGELGASIGTSLTISKQVTSTAPIGIKRTVRIFLNYGGFNYTASAAGISLCDGKAWKPVGLYVAHEDFPL